jgi:ribosome biogenesis GTPase A
MVDLTSPLPPPFDVIEGKCARTGPTAGVTRTVQERVLVHLDPKIYVYDTPGIMPPNVEHVDTAMRLALCGVCRRTRLQTPTHPAFKDHKICNFPQISHRNPLRRPP